MYFDSSNQFYFSGGQIDVIPASVGLHQGDVLGSWLFMMTLQPLLAALDDYIEEEFPNELRELLSFFYVDDGYLNGRTEVVQKAIEFLKLQGKSYGFCINEHKTVVLLGKCDNYQESKNKFDSYSNVGVQGNDLCRIEPSAIHIHPNNILQGVADGVVLPAKYQSTLHGDVSHVIAEKQYGIKVLGSFVGSDAYIDVQLKKILEEWDKIKVELIHFPKSQIRMLLFRYCFCAKPIHLLRTIPPKHTKGLILKFIQFQKEILESMFVQKIDDVLMDLVCLPIEEGGLGMLNLNDIHSIAYIASIIGLREHKDLFIEHLKDNDDAETFAGDLGKELVNNITGLKTYLNIDDASTVAQVIQELDKIRAKSIDDKSTFQSALYILKNRDANRISQREVALKLADKCFIRLISYRNTLNNTAGMWLRTFCKYEQFRLSNNEFCIGLCLRYGLAIPLLPTESPTCNICKAKTKQGDPCCVDRYGHHFLSGCMNDVKDVQGKGQGAQPHAIHDIMRTVLFDITKHAMVPRSIQEPTFLLHQPNVTKQIRPDLEVAFPIQMVRKTFAADIQICCPFAGSSAGKPIVAYKYLENDPDNLPPPAFEDKIINSRVKEKRKKYETICKQRSITFVPFLMYSTGKIHKDAISFLGKLADHSHEVRRIPKKTLVNYYVKLLNCALIKEVSRTIYIKSLDNASTERRANINRRHAIRVGNELTNDIANPRLVVYPPERTI